jgi:two-component system, OmpR family, sensor histidine kinase CreC
VSDSEPSKKWRLIYFVQRLITHLAPPLHSLHWKIMALLLVAIFIPALYFLWQVQRTIARSHLISTEQGMIDTALVIAESFNPVSGAPLANLPMTREVKRRVFRDSAPDLRVILYDARGAVISDTDGLLVPGTMESRSDVKKALQGRYGARWMRDQDRHMVTLYSTVPVFRGPEVIGAVGVIKSGDVRISILESLKGLILPGLLAFLIATFTAYLLSWYLTLVITDLAYRADRIASGEADVRLETWTKSELGDLARAVETMRRKLEGKAYVEEMVTTFSHELKTPLTVIRGATDVIEDSPEPTVRLKFIQNIRAEVDRLTQIVTNLLALSRIETQPVEKTWSILSDVIPDIASIYQTRAEALGLRFALQMEQGNDSVAMPAEQLRRVIEILLDNAFQFTPRGKAVTLRITSTCADVIDEGAGIEPALQQKIFDRFVTTINPLTGRRGTGLGLAIAQSIMTRYHGSIELESAPGSGSRFTVHFPKNS